MDATQLLFQFLVGVIPITLFLLGGFRILSNVNSERLVSLSNRVTHLEKQLVDSEEAKAQLLQQNTHLQQQLIAERETASNELQALRKAVNELRDEVKELRQELHDLRDKYNSELSIREHAEKQLKQANEWLLHERRQREKAQSSLEQALKINSRLEREKAALEKELADQNRPDSLPD